MNSMTFKQVLIQNYAAAKDGGRVNYFVVAVKLPSGATELIINNAADIEGKVKYYLDTYDEKLRMDRVPEINIVNFMFA